MLAMELGPTNVALKMMNYAMRSFFDCSYIRGSSFVYIVLIVVVQGMSISSLVNIDMVYTLVTTREHPLVVTGVLDLE